MTQPRLRIVPCTIEQAKDGNIRARSWNMPGRPRVDKTEIVERQRWSARAVGAEPIALEWPDMDGDQLTLPSTARVCG